MKKHDDPLLTAVIAAAIALAIHLPILGLSIVVANKAGTFYGMLLYLSVHAGALLWLFLLKERRL